MPGLETQTAIGPVLPPVNLQSSCRGIAASGPRREPRAAGRLLGAFREEPSADASECRWDTQEAPGGQGWSQERGDNWLLKFLWEEPMTDVKASEGW